MNKKACGTGILNLKSLKTFQPILPSGRVTGMYEHAVIWNLSIVNNEVTGYMNYSARFFVAGATIYFADSATFVSGVVVIFVNGVD